MLWHDPFFRARLRAYTAACAFFAVLLGLLAGFGVFVHWLFG